MNTQTLTNETPIISLRKAILLFIAFLFFNHFIITLLMQVLIALKFIPDSSSILSITSFISIIITSYYYGYYLGRTCPSLNIQKIKKIAFNLTLFMFGLLVLCFFIDIALFSIKPIVSMAIIVPFLLLIVGSVFQYFLMLFNLRMGFKLGQKNIMPLSKKFDKTIKYSSITILVCLTLFLLVLLLGFGSYIYFRTGFEELLTKQGSEINIVLSHEPQTQEEQAVYCNLVTQTMIINAANVLGDERLIDLYNKTLPSGAPYAERCTE